MITLWQPHSFNFGNFLRRIAFAAGFYLPLCVLGSSDFDIFFINAICFMCFWCGLEILRLAYKKGFWNIEQFLPYLTFYPPKKIAQPCIRFLKNSSKLGVHGIKRSGIFCRFQKCAEVSSSAKGENNFTEKLILGTFCKSVFLRTNLREILDARVLHIF
jgi:hypothetical protein